MKINAYLLFNGQCADALKFYEKCLGGKTVFSMTYGEGPACQETPAEQRDYIMHARFEAEGNVLMCSDCPPDRYDKPAGISISINVDEPEKADRIFAALAEGGTQTMPIAETFWARRFGMVTDKYGTPWMVNCEKKNA